MYAYIQGTLILNAHFRQVSEKRKMRHKKYIDFNLNLIGSKLSNYSIVSYGFFLNFIKS